MNEDDENKHLFATMERKYGSTTKDGDGCDGGTKNAKMERQLPKKSLTLARVLSLTVSAALLVTTVVVAWTHFSGAPPESLTKQLRAELVDQSARSSADEATVLWETDSMKFGGGGSAACSSDANPGCAGLSGDCCPASDGTFLACCNSHAKSCPDRATTPDDIMNCWNAGEAPKSIDRCVGVHKAAYGITGSGVKLLGGNFARPFYFFKGPHAIMNLLRDHHGNPNDDFTLLKHYNLDTGYNNASVHSDLNGGKFALYFANYCQMNKELVDDKQIRYLAPSSPTYPYFLGFLEDISINITGEYKRFDDSVYSAFGDAQEKGNPVQQYEKLTSCQDGYCKKKPKAPTTCSNPQMRELDKALNNDNMDNFREHLSTFFNVKGSGSWSWNNAGAVRLLLNHAFGVGCLFSDDGQGWSNADPIEKGRSYYGNPEYLVPGAYSDGWVQNNTLKTYKSMGWATALKFECSNGKCNKFWLQ